MSRTVMLTVSPDYDCDSPCEWGGWNLYSFSRRHANFRHPDDVFSRSFRKKLQKKQAFVLDCFQHGNVVWSLPGEGPQCRFDSRACAGVLVYEGPAADLKGKDAAEWARSFLKTYNMWANGEARRYSLYSADGDDMGDCGCVLADDAEMLRMIEEELRPGDVLRAADGETEKFLAYARRNREAVR